MGEADECVCSHQRYDAVADRVESVHPMGQPISHSTNGGLRATGSGDVGPGVVVVGARRPEGQFMAWPGRSRPPLPCPVNAPLWPLAVGVGQPVAAALRFRPPRVSLSGSGPPVAARGVRHILATTVSDVAARRPMRSFIARCAAGDFWSSDATGVGQRRAARSVNATPWARVVVGLPPEALESEAVTVGQQPEAVAAMGGANGGCAETAPFRIEPESGKVPKHDVESSSGQGSDVLEERQRRGDFFEGAGNMRPEPAGVVEAPSSAGVGEGLAGETGRDDIHAAAPRPAVEGRDVVPDRSLTQPLVFHPRHEDGRRECVPLDIAHSAVPGAEGESEAELEPAGAGAEAEPMNGPGTWSHVTATPTPRRRRRGRRTRRTALWPSKPSSWPAAQP